MSLKNNQRQAVLITGSSSGIGWQLAKVFAANNFDLVLTGQNEAKLAEIKKITQDYKINCHTISCDLKDRVQIKKLAQTAIEKNVGILINNAGLPCPGKKLELLEVEEMEDILALNLHAPIFLTKYLYQHLLSLKKANIIVLNSMVGLEVKKYRSIYSASKWGLRGFFNSLNEEARENNISVLSVYPTNVKTREYHQNAMDVEFVATEIYNAFVQNKAELILDGRKK